MIFPLAFGGVGAFVLVAMRRGARRKAQLEHWRARYPDQPWMWFERWRTPELESESGKTMWLAIGFALFWNLVSAPVLFMVPRELSDGNRAAARSGGGPGRTSARIGMRLPGDRPVAREEDADDRIVWRLEITSEEPGVDYCVCLFHSRLPFPLEVCRRVTM